MGLLGAHVSCPDPGKEEERQRPFGRSTTQNPAMDAPWATRHGRAQTQWVMPGQETQQQQQRKGTNSCPGNDATPSEQAKDANKRRKKRESRPAKPARCGGG